MENEFIALQDKVVNNIIKYLNEKITDTNDNKMKTYIKYLEERTDLNNNRIKTILKINTKRRITLSEISKIAKALDVEIQSLFRFEEDL